MTVSDTTPLQHSRRAYSGVFWSSVNMLTVNGGGLIIFVVLSRFLQPADFGISAMAATAVALFSVLLPYGFGEALVQRQDVDRSHIDSAFWLSVLIGVACTVIAALVAEPVAAFYGQPTLVWILPLFATKILFDGIGIVPNALISRRLDFRLLVMRTAAATGISGIVAVVLAWRGAGVWALVASQVLVSLVTAVAALIATGYRPGLPKALHHLRDLSRYGLFATGTRGLQFFNGQADQIIVGATLGVHQLGLYAFTRRVFTIANDATSGVLGPVAHPVFSTTQDDPERLRRGFLRATEHVSLIAFPLFVGLAATTPTLLPLLFGPKWAEASLPLSLIAMLGLITCIGTLQASLITALGKASWWFGYQLFTAVTNLAVFLIFARYGLVTMIAVYVVKTYLFWPVPVVMVTRLLDLSPGRYLARFMPPFIAALALFAAAWGAGTALTGHVPAIVVLAGQIGAGALAYLAVILILARETVLAIGQSLLRIAGGRHG